uniref:Uncharacterized protein n=2 Tax=unclassified Prevotella TaxID=2638335 RepID=A0AB33IYY9_9BACT
MEVFISLQQAALYITYILDYILIPSAGNMEYSCIAVAGIKVSDELNFRCFFLSQFVVNG